MQHWLPQVISINEDIKVIAYSDDSSNTVINGIANPSYLDCDMIIIGGGGIVDPDFWAFRNDAISKLIECGKPIYFFNINIYPQGVSSPDFVSKLCSLNARWWVRDTTSVQLLSSVGINATYLPDITFRNGVIPYKRVKKKTTNRIASVFINHYAFMPYFTSSSVDIWAKAQYNARTIAYYIDWLTTFGWNVQIISSQTARFVDDRIPSALLYGLCINKDKIQWDDKPHTWQSMIKKIRDSDLIISQRYHTTTVALASGIPVVDITHHLKNEGLLKDVRIEKISVPYEMFDHKQLMTATTFAENLPGYQEKIATYRADSHMRWQQFDDDWESVIKNFER